MKHCLFYLIFCFGLSGCVNRDTSKQERDVYIQKKAGKYTLIRNGKPFFIKGAAGFSKLEVLKENGGNAIRTWDTTNISSILDQANENGLAVVVGLPLLVSRNNEFFYNDTVRKNNQIKDFELLIKKYRNHPALLMWCVGNELDFDNTPYFNNLFSHFNRIVDMVHKEDPNHPVTTTVANFNRKIIISLQLKCNVDVISFNIFSKIETLRTDLNKFSLIWKGPFMITEWAADGPWEGFDTTIWGAHIEATSTKKAEVYLKRYQRYMPLDSKRFLGSFVFYWGFKQETTSTWFSMFDVNGNKSEAVDVMGYLWKKKRPEHKAPQINYMLVDKLGAKDNVIYTANDRGSAEIKLFEENENIVDIKWEILQEDWFKKGISSNTTFIKAEKGLIISASGLKVTFRAPGREGPYRIFATVYDKFGNYSTCNTPFYVMGK